MFQLTSNENQITCVEEYEDVPAGASIPRGHRWWRTYEQWVADGNTPLPIPKTPLDQVFNSKLQEINNSSTQALSAINSKYPDFEKLSWEKQETEARTWLEWNSVTDNTDPEPVTPILSVIAHARGITLEDICNRVLVKADAYIAAVSQVIANRQVLEDQLTVAYEDAVAAETAGDEDLEDQHRAAMESITWA